MSISCSFLHLEQHLVVIVHMESVISYLFFVLFNPERRTHLFLIVGFVLLYIISRTKLYFFGTYILKMFATNIEKKTLTNTRYRKIIYTDSKLQVVLMSIPPKGNIPLEKHRGSQFIRVEAGRGYVRSGNQMRLLKDGIAIVIPPNTNHVVKSTGSECLKLYSIYSPPEH